jgi:hypothetical protein
MHEDEHTIRSPRTTRRRIREYPDERSGHRSSWFYPFGCILTFLYRDEGLPDESRLEPHDNGGDDDHRPVVDRPLLVASREPAPLFEPVDAALHDVAPRIDRLLKCQRATTPCRAPRPLITPLWDGVRDLARSEQSPTARIAISFVGDEAIWTRPRPSPPTGSWNTDAAQHRRQLRAVVPLSWRDHDRERSAFPIAGEVKLGG